MMLFLFDGRILEKDELKKDNGDDMEFLEWLNVAQDGDVFPSISGGVVAVSSDV